MSVFTWIHSRSSRNQRAVKEFLLILEVIGGGREPEAIGLSKLELVDLRKRARYLYYICYNVTLSIPIMFALQTPYFYFRYVDMSKYWLNCLVAHTGWTVWVTINIATSCLSLSYFHIICYTLKLRIGTLRNNLEMTNPSAITPQTLLRTFKEQVAVCTVLHEYNTYWSMYIYASYQGFLPLMSMMLYISFVPDDSLAIRAIFFVLFIEFGSLLSFTCLSAADISNQVPLL